MNKTLFALILILFTLNKTVFAHDAFFKNDLTPMKGHSKSMKVVTENDFNTIIELLHRIYSPDIEEKSGLKFVIISDWNNSLVNAYATRSVDSWNVHVNGGFARANGMTSEAFALSVCHEIGHHLGGAPRTFLYEGWPSAEGQADYFATSKCLKRYFAELELMESTLINKNSIPEKVLMDCNSVYKNLDKFKICVRSQMATLDFAEFINALPNVRIPAKLGATDSRVVKGTNTNDYPRPQCRFDTLYQGSLCAINSDVATSDTDAKIGHCNDESKPGTRPRCWYKP